MSKNESKERKVRKGKLMKLHYNLKDRGKEVEVEVEVEVGYRVQKSKNSTS